MDNISLVDTEPLSDEVLRGKELFYNASSLKLNASGYMSCVSCHLDGGHDGNTWDMTSLGEGLRNTIDLRGHAGTAYGRLHWTANFDEVHDFENQIRLLGDGIGLMSDEDFLETQATLGNPKAGLSQDLDALAAYVASLDEFPPSPYRNQDGTLTTDAEAGKIIFQDQKCFNCHSGQTFTDSPSDVLHDIGTSESGSGKRLGKVLPGFDTPALRGIWQTAPYLHDGSANTLAEVFMTRNPNDVHGNIAELSSNEFDQLLAYLKQLDGQNPAALPSDLSLSLQIGEITPESVPLSFESNLSEITLAIYFVNGIPIDTVAEAPFETKWDAPIGGSHHIMVKVWYDGGRIGMVSPPQYLEIDIPLNIPALTTSPNIIIYPNPAIIGESLRISVDVNVSQYIQVDLFSLDGKHVFDELIYVKQGEDGVEIESFTRTSGMYLMHIRGDGWRRAKRVLIVGD